MRGKTAAERMFPLSIDIKELDYENYGKCVSVSNGIIEAVVTIDVGPRIVRFGFCGEKNLFYNDLERKGVVYDKDFDELYGEGSKFYNYGGHRLWLSPESYPATYYPDNEPVVYGILRDGVSFTPAKQRHNDMQLSFELMMSENATDIMVVHSAKNCSKDEQTLALWAVTMMNPGGLEIIPQNQGGSDLLPNRTLVLWPYTDLHDKRVNWGKKFITLRHDSAVEDGKRFKMGIDNLLGWAAYVNDGYVMIKRYVHNLRAAYPDFGASYETYLTKEFLEMETLSPLYHIEPGETVRHVENLSLFRAHMQPNPDDEEQLEKFISEL